MVIVEEKTYSCMDVMYQLNLKKPDYFPFYFQRYAHFSFLVYQDSVIRNLKKQQQE